jgi:hypothetical protein
MHPPQMWKRTLVNLYVTMDISMFAVVIGSAHQVPITHEKIHMSSEATDIGDPYLRTISVETRWESRAGGRANGVWERMVVTPALIYVCSLQLVSPLGIDRL